MSDTKTAEALWARAHDHVKRGDFANAVRDLAQCFQILQALNDPRVYEVHKRWTEVHRMYMEEGQKKPEPVVDKAPSVEAEAEAAANAGDLDKAIALYRQAQQQHPENELITERLVELTKAKDRAHDLVSGTAPVTTTSAPVTTARAPVTTTSAPATKSAPVTTVTTSVSTIAAKPVNGAHAKAEDDWSDINVDEPAAKPAPAAAATVQPKVAPTMAVDDAPVGMQSLDVPFSVGEPIDAFQADELPVGGAASTPPKARSVDEDVAFLEELLSRLQANRAAPRAARS